MNQAQRISVNQALRILGGSIYDSNYAQRAQQIHGLMRVTNRLDKFCQCWHDDIHDIYHTALELQTTELLDDFRAKYGAHNG